MSDSLRDVMTTNPRTVGPADSIVEVAQIMRDADVGSVVIIEAGVVSGIVTDRDIVVRAVAEGRNPTETTVADVANGREVVTVSADQSVDDVIALMREQKIRRVPVVEDGNAVGIVSLGDLAIDREPRSALAQISEPPSNN